MLCTDIPSQLTIQLWFIIRKRKITISCGQVDSQRFRVRRYVKSIGIILHIDNIIANYLFLN